MGALSQLKDAFKAKAQQVGFTQVGITEAFPAPHIDAFHHWVEQDGHAGMAYLARPDTLAKRADPRLILADCQRVICLAMPYLPPQAPLGETRSGYGRVSAYALTVDYHLTIEEKLNELALFLNANAPKAVAVRSYVDTGPVLERAFAEQAGVGMPGKNTNLIIPGVGSYVFLAVMLTDLPLLVDPPFTRDLCGSCQRCIEACPTGCILPDRTIDAARCISYLTIENKSSIPDELKPKVGSWFFGCDACQMVCPHNARPGEHTSPLGDPSLPEFVNLYELLAWDEFTITTRFADTALLRAKRRGLLRNAAVVLGNQGDTNALPLLRRHLAEENDPVLQDAFAWAIRQINGEDA
jgi:epoxyqueuosine reductase